MPHYLVTASYTHEAWATMARNPQDRASAVRPLIEGLGGKLDAFYFAFGDDDVVVLAEVPDNVSAAALAIAVTSSGSLKSYRTTVLMTPQEAMEAMRKATSAGYRPPA